VNKQAQKAMVEVVEELLSAEARKPK